MGVKALPNHAPPVLELALTESLPGLERDSCGQSYRCESTADSSKGEFRYVKLISRELSDRKGFGDFFEQECQALLQLEGVGLWPMKDFGIMKWKHWISYEWFEGKNVLIPSPVRVTQPRKRARVSRFFAPLKIS